jgi:CheY-like chemotaxis protein
MSPLHLADITAGTEAGAPLPGEAITHPTECPGVLVVDDEPAVRNMLQLVLEHHGFAVRLAASGREALALYERHRDRLDVVLLDIRMPGLDGPQTFDALRCLDPEVPVCFMSGSAGGYQPEQLRQRGACRVFAKPFCLEELTETLWRLAHDRPARK